MLRSQFDPSVFDFLDTDRIGSEFFRYKGLQESFIRTPEAVEAVRQSRAEAMQAQQAAEAAKAVGSLGGAEGIESLSNLAQ